MMFIKSALVLAAIVVSAQSVKLPDYFSQCMKEGGDVGQCVTDSANKGLPTFLNGDKNVHVIPLKPLHVPQMFIDVDGSLKINLTDAEIFGLEDAKIISTKFDFDAKTMDMTFTAPQAGLIGTYDINGRILILPIQGNGPCNITFINGVYEYHIEFEMEEKHGKEYIKIVKNSMPYKVDRAYFKLDNLFNGDKRLGEEMSKFLDENWKEVNGEIGARVGDALSEVFSSVINNFFSRVPLNELFA